MRCGHLLILIVVSLLAMGVLMVTSAGLTVGSDNGITQSGVLIGRHMQLALLALGALTLGALVPVGRLSASPVMPAICLWIIVCSIALLLLVHVPGLTREMNHAKRWIQLGPLSFQPSELAKWGLILVIAWYATRRAEVMGRLVAGFVKPICVVGFICAMIAVEDFGTAVLIMLVAVIMLIAAGVRLLHVGALAPVAALGIGAALIHSPYRINRLKAFLDPYGDPDGIGYHMIQSMAAVSAGELPGRGLGAGVQKFGYLPEDTTDFVFAIICEELGIAGALLVVFLYVALLFSGYAILRSTSGAFARLLCMGVLLTIGFQTLINLAVVTGLGPTKGIALPLISSGGTGWAMTAFMIGLLVAIDRENGRAAMEMSQSRRPADGQELSVAAPADMALGRPSVPSTTS